MFSKDDCYHHGENLVKDHALNPKYICPKCAREIRNFQKLRVSKDKFKKQKCDKKFIPRLAPSETDCEPSKCSHSKYNIGVLKNIWLSLDLMLIFSDIICTHFLCINVFNHEKSSVKS